MKFVNGYTYTINFKSYWNRNRYLRFYLHVLETKVFFSRNYICRIAFFLSTLISIPCALFISEKIRAKRCFFHLVFENDNIWNIFDRNELPKECWAAHFKVLRIANPEFQIFLKLFNFFDWRLSYLFNSPLFTPDQVHCKFVNILWDWNFFIQLHFWFYYVFLFLLCIFY